MTAEDGSTTRTYTVSVTRAGAPLTASFVVEQPAQHTGSGSFSIRILFSEPVPALGSESFSVTNGRVQDTRRVDGRGDLWEIDFAPSSNEDVHVVLPETDDCEAVGGVCTADGRRLQSRLEAVVPGPSMPEVSITAASSAVTEGTAARFNVTLGEAASEALTVSVRVTQSGSVLAGTPVSELTLAAGDMTATLSVDTEADSVVEGDSTVAAMLTAGTGYSLGTASSASVTVEDDDTATFTVAAAPETIAEGESATLTVAISNGVTFAEAQTISLATSGTASGSDYAGVPETLTLAAGTRPRRRPRSRQRRTKRRKDPETVTVTASHGGSAIGSATVTIESVSRDATLASLSLSGIDIGTFSGTVTAYQASVANSVTATTVSAGASHAGATVSIEPGSDVDLAEGANVITITVTAEDGSTTRTYAVTVTRAALPVLSIMAVTSPVSEGERAEFRLARTGSTDGALSVTADVEASHWASPGAQRIYFGVRA